MNKLTKFVTALMITLIIAVPVVALAQGNIIPGTDFGLPGNGDEDAENLLVLIIMTWLLPIAGIIAVLFIIIGGFQYMFAGANEKLAERGRGTLRNAIIGLIIVVLSYAVVTVVVNTLFRLDV
jgi:hypothetical protein